MSNASLPNAKSEKTLTRSNSKAIPTDIVSYIEEHDINQVVKSAVNKVLRELPADPLASIAALLVQSAQKSYPVFKKFEAKRIFLCDSSAHQSLSIDVHLSFQGRTEVKHTHTFTYDEACADKFCWDNQEAKSGLKKACDLINNELTQKLKDMLLNSSIPADNALDEFVNSHQA